MQSILATALPAIRGLSSKPWHGQIARKLSIFSRDNNVKNDQHGHTYESLDDFEKRIFSDSEKNTISDSFYKKLARIEKARGRLDLGSEEGRNWSSDGLEEGSTTLSDGMNAKLKKAATHFEYDTAEIEKEDYPFRPDSALLPGNAYGTKDLDPSKFPSRRPLKRPEFTVTTKEVLQRADFRNVRFLANFITPAGLIIKRNKTKISAKAQRRVAREIKTARAFGLMPFTSMGSKHFVFGKTMQEQEENYNFYNSRAFRAPQINHVHGASQDPLRV